MKTKPGLKSTNKGLKNHSSKLLFEKKSKLPLSQQAQLASDALVLSRLLELINDIEAAPERTKEIDTAMIDLGIKIIESLKEGEKYLNQRKSKLIQRPESTDTVQYIKRRTRLKISESSDIVLTVLNELKNWTQSRSSLDTDKLQLAKHFLRDIHTGIMDQLEASGEIDLDL